MTPAPEERKQVSTVVHLAPVREGLFHLPTGPEDRPYLIGSRCRACGRSFFPRRSLCPSCQTEEALEEVPLSTEGVLYSYCVIYTPPEGFEAPYALGYVDLPEDLRIFAPLAADDLSTLKIGMPMELVVEKLCQDEAGNPIVSYKFRAKE
ncbi:MAG: Zn-ribbon domain-containing OB-fold protein [Candidatus Tectomicrobia bacterium]|uniref:Zn-ribbon domain-containing OB-fold protein n=1 Tax=Tectimicrobiota bacterium TaxID=2528274 RepID=A0A932CMT2_UNCTE|nr:Zn-ribbon domain-containing OB-fold protein [Candidatus Tectomicrobia bacterium]